MGAVLRYLWIVKIPNPPIMDFLGYYKTALSFYRHQGLAVDGEPAGYVGIMYPLVLGCYFLLVGHSDVFTAKVFNVIISTASLVVFFFMMRKLLPNRRLAMAGYLILALLPNYIAYNSVLGSEILFTFLFAVTLWISITKVDNRWRYPLLGILCAVTALTRPFFLAYPAVLVMLHWIQTKSLKRSVAMAASVFVAMALTLSPWIYRNYKTFDAFIPVSYNGGVNLFINNNSDNLHGGYMPLEKVTPREGFKEKLRSVGAEYPQYSPKLEPLYRAEAQHWIVTHPLQFLQLGVAREKLTFFSGANDIEMWAIAENANKNTRRFMLFRHISDIVIHVLSGCGLLFLLINIPKTVVAIVRKRRIADFPSVILTMNILFYAAIYFVFEGQARYNFPVLFLLVIATLAFAYNAMQFDRLMEKDPVKPQSLQ
ncbi:ArnT family glycosyltransferase [Effusibacillus pohliae]|uniref:ArnT family glycosyltransferase n=1 Tax=Effusibacillus pohliae TaxID=232270 RepID=UPI0012EA4CC7|nr:glycosyltransferase family 39 protein [Effusibacillus pohliae]